MVGFFVFLICQYACPHHQSNRLVACSANFVSLSGHVLRGKSSTLSIDRMSNHRDVIDLV